MGPPPLPPPKGVPKVSKPRSDKAWPADALLRMRVLVDRGHTQQARDAILSGLHRTFNVEQTIVGMCDRVADLEALNSRWETMRFENELFERAFGRPGA